MPSRPYQVITIRDTARPGCARINDILANDIIPEMSTGDLRCFGTFNPLFGLSSNESYLVMSGADSAATPRFNAISERIQTAGLEVANRTTLLATVRPTNHIAADAPGVYVFRWFTVKPGTTDEIVALSAAAWPSFEHDFETRVQGLFVEAADEPQTMLLITWYKDLSVWEASRAPSAASRENFLKRHQLTLNALPVATQLSLPGATPKLVSHT